MIKTVDEWRKEDSVEQGTLSRSKSPNPTRIGDGLTPIHGISINTNSNMMFSPNQF